MPVLSSRIPFFGKALLYTQFGMASTFLEEVYNAKRLHSSLDDVLPDEFESKYVMC
jgi:transposase InsO family protein